MFDFVVAAAWVRSNFQPHDEQHVPSFLTASSNDGHLLRNVPRWRPLSTGTPCACSLRRVSVQQRSNVRSLSPTHFLSEGLQRTTITRRPRCTTNPTDTSLTSKAKRATLGSRMSSSARRSRKSSSRLEP